MADGVLLCDLTEEERAEWQAEADAEWLASSTRAEWAELLDEDDLADPSEAGRRYRLIVDRMVSESEELFVRGVLRPDAGPLTDDEWEEWRVMVDDGLPVLVEGGGRLERFVWKVKNGRPLKPWDLEFVAAGIERHLAKPGANPWPINRPKSSKKDRGGRVKSETGPGDEKWRQAAEVQFYRRLLPAIRGKKGPSRSAFAAQFGYRDDKSVSDLEKLKPPPFAAGNRPPVFTLRIEELIQQEGLNGVVYDSWASELVRSNE